MSSKRKRETEIIKDYSYEEADSKRDWYAAGQRTTLFDPEALATYSPKYLKILEAISKRG